MSFSQDVKEELFKHVAGARHCKIAGAAAIIYSQGYVKYSQETGSYCIYMQTENELALRKLFTILKKAYNIDTNVLEKPAIHHDGRVYRPILDDPEETRMLLKSLRMLDENGAFRPVHNGVSKLITRNSCCKRAYLRDTFLCIGSMSDPDKSYHIEFDCIYQEHAEIICELMRDFGIEARTIVRKRYFVVYLKEGAEIVDLLNVMEAPISLMNLENTRIVKEMRNSINRRVNCETANISKTVNAAARQVESIIYIRDHYGFDNLKPELRQMAEVRLANPEGSLIELGKLLDPPVGKSGVNHRLRKLGELAEKLQEHN